MLFEKYYSDHAAAAAVTVSEKSVIVFDAVFVIIILDCRLDRFFCEDRAVQFVSGKSAQRIDDLLVCDRERLGNSLALDELGSHR